MNSQISRIIRLYRPLKGVGYIIQLSVKDIDGRTQRRPVLYCSVVGKVSIGILKRSYTLCY